MTSQISCQKQDPKRVKWIGNLLSDGVNTYDSANRLIEDSNQSSVTSYQNNGLGDRLAQNDVHCTLDLNSGFTQVLDDGENTYLYGNGRISQTGNSTEYFLGDALGSVRQLTNSAAEITLAKSYAPYGELRSTSGGGVSPFAFTGEQVDESTGLVYLRARYYASHEGRFLSRDTWGGDYNSPLSLNRWGYVEGNPVIYIDPTGMITQSESGEADKIVKELRTYRVFVEVDWGEYALPIRKKDSGGVVCGWGDGNWHLKELVEIRKGIVDASRAMNGLNNFIFNFGYIRVYRVVDSNKAVKARGGYQVLKVNDTRHDIDRWTTVHELGHVWDAENNWQLSVKLADFTKQFGKNWGSPVCDPDKRLPGCNDAGYVYYDVLAGGADRNMNAREDFANSFAAYVYPTDTQGKIEKYETLDSGKYKDYLYYTDYRKTLRWKVIDTLIQITNNYRPR
jgi:RHS repeat-associated protein